MSGSKFITVQVCQIDSPDYLNPDDYYTVYILTDNPFGERMRGHFFVTSFIGRRLVQEMASLFRTREYLVEIDRLFIDGYE